MTFDTKEPCIIEFAKYKPGIEKPSKKINNFLTAEIYAVNRPTLFHQRFGLREMH